MRDGAPVRVAVGVVVLLTAVWIPPGEGVLGWGPVRFDPALALLAGFAFTAVRGVGSLVGTGSALGE